MSALQYFSKNIRKVNIQSNTDMFPDKIMYNQQFGFTQNHSSSTALIEDVDQISYLMNNNNFTIGILLLDIYSKMLKHYACVIL